MLSKNGREPLSGQEVAQTQMAAFREWEQVSGERFSVLRAIRQPTLVATVVHDHLAISCPTPPPTRTY
jgi:hypothetical protein